MALLLSGCGPIYQTTYSYKPAPSSSGKLCTAQCFQTKNSCQQICQLQDQNCRLQAHQEAYYRYSEYLREQKAAGKKARQQLSSFDHSYTRCNNSCHCTADFNACYQSCGGQVMTKRICTAFCN